jgi:diguanylate cyclase (GGDEF)-like protein
MADEKVVTVTKAHWGEAQARARRVALRSLAVAFVVAPALGVLVISLTELTSSGPPRFVVAAAWMFVLVTPMNYSIYRINLRQRLASDRMVATLTSQLSDAVTIASEEASRQEAVARRQEFASRLANALEMADGEPEVIGVIERSFSTVLPESPVELLLADNSHAHLLRMAATSPTGVPPGCGVDSPDHCPAARRAQVQCFPDSEELDACPKLHGRPGGPVSALCVPVAIMGRTVGVIHATRERGGSFPENAEEDLEILAKSAGARIGMLRAMVETQLQAATDSLTGLLNRRSFEQRVSVVRRNEPILAIAMADLDQFKLLNDTYGHETGDRALRLFARVLTESLRAHDLVCRQGGEEFVVALPACTAEGVRTILDALSVRLQAAIAVAGLPNFTVSFGVVEADRQEDLPVAIDRADAALFQAKREGRNQVVVHDAVGNVVEPGQRGAVAFSSAELPGDESSGEFSNSYDR